MTQKSNKTQAAIQVEVLSTAGCANAPPTVALIESTAAALGIPIDLSHVLLVSPEEARQRRFHGSPTVLVNGVDIDPSMRDEQSFGFT
jgi:hypothetical protein